MLASINKYSSDSSYKVEVSKLHGRAAITLPCGLESNLIEESILEKHFFRSSHSSGDYFLKELWPSEFSFDFDLTIEAWKDLIICERRSPFETDGLTKKEAEWAWILVNQWASTPIDTKDEFLDLYYEAKPTFEALGWDLYLNEKSQQKLLDLFGAKNPILVNYKPSMKIVEFYRNIWNPLKNKLQNT